MYKFLDNYERSQMSTASPLGDTSKGAISRVVPQGDMDKMFKDNGAPMLETNERGQFEGFWSSRKISSTATAGSTKKHGVAHIPIERAMDLIVKRGLPVLPADSSPATVIDNSTRRQCKRRSK
jgi:hypothetical protein